MGKRPAPEGAFVATTRFDPTRVSGAPSCRPQVSTSAAAQRRSEGSGPLSSGHQEHSSHTRLYVGGLPFHYSEGDVVRAFESCGDVSADLMRFPDTGRFRGIAVLTFGDAAGAEKALAWDGTEWEGKFLVVRPYERKSVSGSAAKMHALPDPEKQAGCTTAFLCNLPYDVHEGALREELLYGLPIEEVRFGKDRETGAFRGTAHVRFGTEQAVDDAVGRSLQQLSGRPIKISYAKGFEHKPRDGLTQARPDMKRRKVS
mmetsp:Transcript_1928/g.6738  ORF Transcript_1928/g.6738 Transcript_1928/m.6738 type:complete len:258 (-) Transcript_1928:1404-2177(-)